MMNFKIKSTAGTENFTATADTFVERNWNKSALLLTFVATDKSKCRPHRAVELKSNIHGWAKKYNSPRALGGALAKVTRPYHKLNSLPQKFSLLLWEFCIRYCRQKLFLMLQYLTV